MTRNGGASASIDIDPFLIQDETNGDNYIKYNVASVVLTPNSYITLTVTYLSGGGSGETNFGNTNLIKSAFTNNIEVDGRLQPLKLRPKNVAAVK